MKTWRTGAVFSSQPHALVMRASARCSTSATADTAGGAAPGRGAARREDGLREARRRRADARGPAGLDEAIRRAHLYAAAGADMVFPDALLPEDEFARFAAAVPHPKMMNMGGYATRRTTPKLPLETVERLGFNLVIFPLAVIRAGVRAMVDFVAGLRERGTAFEVEHIEGLRGHAVENWYEFSGIGEIRQLEEQYLPPAAVEQKYAGGQGYRP